MIFRTTKVIRSSFIHEGEPAGRSRVPGIRGNHIYSGLQLCRDFGLFFGPLAFIDVNSQALLAARKSRVTSVMLAMGAGLESSANACLRVSHLLVGNRPPRPLTMVVRWSSSSTSKSRALREPQIIAGETALAETQARSACSHEVSQMQQ